MMQSPNLFMLVLGCRPKGRHTEQHDVFFGIGNSLKELAPSIKQFWPAAGEIHIDAWRTVTAVNGHAVAVKMVDNTVETLTQKNDADLFFINLGGYKENEFEEFHYKMLVVAADIDAAKSSAKKTAFFKHTSLPAGTNTRNASAHIDDKFGIDIDEMYAVKDILPPEFKNKYSIEIGPLEHIAEDPYNLGYYRLKDL